MPRTRRAPKIDRTSISYQLRKAIEARADLTASSLARAAEVDASTISRFLSGDRDIKLDTAAAIAKALGLRLVSRGKRGSEDPEGQVLDPATDATAGPAVD
jgi:transcriptional regulator with XRE-family HTH domain